MPKPDKLELHKRARESASEFRKLTTALSAGGVASMFISLTTEIKPALTNAQQALAATAVCCFGAAVLCGILGWQADSERWYFGAKEAETDELLKNQYSKQRKRWANRTWRLSRGLRSLFFIGVSVAVLYVLARVFHW